MTCRRRIVPGHIPTPKAMILVHLSVLALLSGVTICSFEVQQSPDAIFYFHVTKLRSKHRTSKTQSVNDVLGLIKNGTEVASKIHGVFDSVHKMKEGPFNATALVEFGTNVYNVGTQAVDYGKKVYAVGKDVFDAAKGFLEKNQALLQVGKTLGKTLGSIAKNIGPALGGVGVAFVIIGLFIPKEEDAQLTAIKLGFQEMHLRFDQISNQLKLFEEKMDFYQAIRPYQEVRNSLEIVHGKYLQLLDRPTSDAYKTEFKDACRNQHIEPLQALRKLHRIIVSPHLEDQQMVKSIIKQYKLDYKIIMAWFERITVNAYTLAMLRSACFGTLYQQEDPGREHGLNQTETWVKEIIAELGKYEEKFTNIDQEYVEVLKTDLSSIPSTYSPEAERQENERCDVVEMGLVGWNTECRGDPQVNGKRIAVNNYLNTKYYWLNWLVVVYENREPDTDNPCGGPPGLRWAQVKSDKLRVFVAWARKDAVEAVQWRQKGADFLKELTRDFSPDLADRWFGRGKAYFNDQHMKAWNGMSQWIINTPYTNKTACYFGGNKKYHRAITTAGVAAHRIQQGGGRRNDYVLIFW